MITVEMIEESIKTLRDCWQEQGDKVIEEIWQTNRTSLTSEQFLENCTACGGDWSRMLLTGINKMYPTVWDLIPEDMGKRVWECLIAVLILLGVDTSEK